MTAAANDLTAESGHAEGCAPASVVICAYTEQRWAQTVAAAESALQQEPRPAQVILVIDHNSDLLARAMRELTGVTVLGSLGPPGLSGARNTGLKAANQPVTVFLDDDAEARPGWLAAHVAAYGQPGVIATGGAVHPRWPVRRPRWLPSTFDWVIGCSYLGLPETVAAIRNPIGANMSFRTDLARDAGGFDCTVGRVRGKPRGCEETELAIRVTAGQPEASILYVPAATVDHHVSAERISISYFLRRCWSEGRSKATMVRLTGAGSGLRSERHHVKVVIPREIVADSARILKGDIGAVGRIVTAIAGLGVTTLGYLAGRMGAALRPGRQTSSATPAQANPA